MLLSFHSTKRNELDYTFFLCAIYDIEGWKTCLFFSKGGPIKKIKCKPQMGASALATSTGYAGRRPLPWLTCNVARAFKSDQFSVTTFRFALCLLFSPAKNLIGCLWAQVVRWNEVNTVFKKLRLELQLAGISEDTESSWHFWVHYLMTNCL